MTGDSPGLDSTSNLVFEKDLQAITDLVQQVMSRYPDDTDKLLKLLRLLESQHRQVREGPFLAGLPASRQALYHLLREMEKAGGWPYIPSMPLRAFLQYMEQTEASSDS